MGGERTSERTKVLMIATTGGGLNSVMATPIDVNRADWIGSKNLSDDKHVPPSGLNSTEFQVQVVLNQMMNL